MSPPTTYVQHKECEDRVRGAAPDVDAWSSHPCAPVVACLGRNETLRWNQQERRVISQRVTHAAHSRLGTRTFLFLVATLPLLLSHHAIRSATGGGLFEQFGFPVKTVCDDHGNHWNCLAASLAAVNLAVTYMSPVPGGQPLEVKATVVSCCQGCGWSQTFPGCAPIPLADAAHNHWLIRVYRLHLHCVRCQWHTSRLCNYLSLCSMCVTLRCQPL
ncbi:hypothetical protein V8C86DRAFT_1030738 [Haematococcus lacustris]